MKILLLLGLLLCVSCQPTVSEFMDQCMSSPETLHDMEKITKDVSVTLNEVGITHWLDSGTLLGAYRFSSHMPYDDDVDFGVVRKEYELHKIALHDKLAEKGYELMNWDLDPSEELIPQIFFKNNHGRAHLDLFLFEPLGSSNHKLRLSSSYWHKVARHAGKDGLGFPQDVIFHADGSLSRIKLLNHEYNAPAQIDAYFKRWYKESDILTNFMMTQAHGGGICSEPVVIKDIRNDRKSLDRMFDHLEKVFEGRFNRTDSRLY